MSTTPDANICERIYAGIQLVLFRYHKNVRFTNNRLVMNKLICELILLSQTIRIIIRIIVSIITKA